MSKSPTTKDFAANAKVVSRSYRGPDRRDPEQAASSRVERTVKFDAKGNPVLEVRTDVPRRRGDDKTIDLLKCLDADALNLRLEDDDKAPGTKRR